MCPYSNKYTFGKRIELKFKKYECISMSLKVKSKENKKVWITK